MSIIDAIGSVTHGGNTTPVKTMYEIYISGNCLTDLII